MAENGNDKSLTFGLDGEVRLSEMVRAFQQFTVIADALAEESNSATSAKWVVDGLRSGSAFVTATSHEMEAATFLHVENRFLQLADEMQTGRIVSFPDRVQKSANTLLRLVSPRIPDLVFETARETKIIEARADATPKTRTLVSHGVLRGRVQTLSSRNALRFALYEPVHDQAVNCYLSADQQELARGIWDRWAAIEGTITRNVVTGVPLSMRDIKRVVILQTSEPGSFRDARGITLFTGELPEDRIRRLRDG